MPLYRVSMKDNDGHRGYAWFTSQREADRRAAAFRTGKQTADSWGEHKFSTAEIDTFDTPRTKRGWVALLSKVAGHEDNG